MSRADELVPDGWTPKRGIRVIVQPSRDEPAPPAGVWRIIERSNGEPGSWWWVQPVDDTARAWLTANPSRAVQGCTSVRGLLLTPPGTPLRRVEGTTKRGRR